jgi:ribosomal-protein-alanine N-acetyltransferase
VQTKTPLDFGSVSIAGDRVKLVPISPEYAEVIFEEFTDEITRYMVPATPATLQEIHVFIQSSMSKMEENIDLTLAILKKNDDEFLGVCGLHGEFNPNEPILGLWLKKSAHGHKYGQEAIKVLAEWARQNIILDYMVYPCDKDNIPSRKIAENLNGSIFRSGEVKSMSGRVLNEIAYKIV